MNHTVAFNLMATDTVTPEAVTSVQKGTLRQERFSYAILRRYIHVLALFLPPVCKVSRCIGKVIEIDAVWPGLPDDYGAELVLSLTVSRDYIGSSVCSSFSFTMTYP
jgi:hypothetical protein